MTIGAWERFAVVVNADGSVSFKALVNGRYVTADNAGASALIANRTSIGAWERFDEYLPPALVSLRAANGLYVTAENGGALPLIANRSAVGPWESFRAVINLDASLSLLALANGRYVTAGSDPLAANGPAIGPGQRFRRTVM